MKRLFRILEFIGPDEWIDIQVQKRWLRETVALGRDQIARELTMVVEPLEENNNANTDETGSSGA